jgi:dCTP diphosphatase
VTGDLESIKEELRDFARERCWEQFHSPKNLSMALIVETAELVEHFQWLTEENSYVRDGLKVKEISYELSDILMYLIRLADILEIDLVAAYREKIEIIRAKYPPKSGIED